MTLTPEAKTLIERWPLGFVATVTDKGEPRVSPKGTFAILDDNTLCFGNVRSPGTMKNLRENPQVEVNFMDFITRKGFRVRGTTEIVGPDEPRFAGMLENQREMWGGLAERISQFVIVHVTFCKEMVTPPYDESPFHDRATEEEMISLYKNKIAKLYP